MYFIPKIIVASDRIAVMSYIVHFVFKSFIYCRFKKNKNILYLITYRLRFVHNECVCFNR